MTRSTDDNITRAFASIRARIARGPRGDAGVLWSTPEALLAVLTPERLRIYRHLRSKGPATSIKALAKRTRRDETRVGRDVVALEAAGLVRTTREGKTKRIEADERPIVLH